MNNDNSTDGLARVCDRLGGLLEEIEQTKDTLPHEETLASVVETLSGVLTESRRVITLVSANEMAMQADLSNKSADLESTKVTLGLLKISYQGHRGMLEKIVRMKTSAGGRNMEAATAAESFLAQNPAVI